MSSNPFMIDNTNMGSPLHILSFGSGVARSDLDVTRSHTTSDELFHDNGIFTTQEDPYGAVNYSPKHSRKSSLHNRNTKNLSLNLMHNDTNKKTTSGDTGKLQSSHNKPRLHKRRSLAVLIPSEESQDDLSLITPLVMSTPVFPPPQLISRAKTTIGYSRPQGLKSFKPTPLEALQSSGSPLQNLHNSSNELQSPFLQGQQTKEMISTFRNVKINDSNIQEELQESSQLNAYPNGPANVLNDCIFLYSDPTMGVVDINDYDLVINVARECKNLEDQFNTQHGKKEYIYVPWSHTSSILKELPNLTEKIRQYDDSGEPNVITKRKILIHCQCGVSRSACVVVAYFIMKFNIGVNRAYELLKSGTTGANDSETLAIRAQGYEIEACDRICPNMSLIFELMDFSDRMSK